VHLYAFTYKERYTTAPTHLLNVSGKAKIKTPKEKHQYVTSYTGQTILAQIFTF